MACGCERQLNVHGGALTLEVLRAACLDFCVQFWFIVKHSESGSRKGEWSTKRAGLVAVYKIVWFLICQYDKNKGGLFLRGSGDTMALHFVCALEEGL